MTCEICKMTDGQHSEFCPNKFTTPLALAIGEEALPTKPQDRIEKADMRAITSPRSQKSLATNQGVRFHVNAETEALRAALMEALQKVSDVHAHALRLAFDDFNAAVVKANEATAQLAAALDIRIQRLESRWWNRLWIDLIWDVDGIIFWIRRVALRQMVPTLVDEQSGATPAALATNTRDEPEPVWCERPGCGHNISAHPQDRCTLCDCNGLPPEQIFALAGGALDAPET